MYRMYIIIFMVLGALENVLQLKSESQSKKVGVWNSAKYECWHFPACTNTNCERTKDTQATYRGVAGRDGSEKREEGRG